MSKELPFRFGTVTQAGVLSCFRSARRGMSPRHGSLAREEAVAAKQRQTLDGINGRFASGQPSSDPDRMGLFVHVWDNTEDVAGRQSWLPCSAEAANRAGDSAALDQYREPGRCLAMNPRDRLPTGLLFRSMRRPGLASDLIPLPLGGGRRGGVILRPRPGEVRCGFGCGSRMRQRPGARALQALTREWPSVAGTTAPRGGGRTGASARPSGEGRCGGGTARRATSHATPRRRSPAAAPALRAARPGRHGTSRRCCGSSAGGERRPPRRSGARAAATSLWRVRRPRGAR